MNLTLTIDAPLAADLRAFAEARSISVDELARQALQLGLAQLVTPLAQLGIENLGSLHPAPLTAEQLARMRSPIFACAPIPDRTLQPFDDFLRETSRHAH